MVKSDERPAPPKVIVVVTTVGTEEQALDIAHHLVRDGLAACVNILPGMISHYWWEGQIDRGEEVVMIIKTRASLAERVRAAVKEKHSYTTPAVLVLPVESVDPAYHAWIEKETSA